MRAFLLTADHVAALDFARAEPRGNPSMVFPPLEDRVRATWAAIGEQSGFDPATVRTTLDPRLVYAEPA